MEKIKEKIKKIPQKPGIYVFKDKKGKIIYIGKALALRSRVQSYFRPSLADAKTKKLAAKITDLAFVIVASELEALLLEARLIKQHQPQYNLALKDSKSYLYIAITQEPLPRVFLTRRPELKKPLLDWYGPFPSAGDARRLLHFCRRIFPHRSCPKLPRKVCLYYHLELCPGVCVQKNPAYAKTIRQIRQFFSGKTQRLIKNLEKEMKSQAQKLKFEEAEKIKRQIMSLQALPTGWQRLPPEKIPIAKALQALQKLLVKHGAIDPFTLNKIEAYDVANLSKEIIVGAMVVFINGTPEKALSRRFKINFKTTTQEARQRLLKQNDPAAIFQTIARRLSHPEWLYPQLILVDGGKAQVGAAFKAVSQIGLANQIALLGLAKKQEKLIFPQIKNQKITGYKTCKLSLRRPEQKLLQQIRDEAHRFAQKYFHYLQRKRLRS